MFAFTKSMVIELSARSFRVNHIAPDHTISPGNQGNCARPVDRSSWRQHPAEEVDAMNRLIQLEREGVDSECRDSAVFLCSVMV